MTTTRLIKKLAETTLEKAVSIDTPKLLTNTAKIGAPLGALYLGYQDARDAKNTPEGETKRNFVGRALVGAFSGAMIGVGAGCLIRAGAAAITFFTPLDKLRAARMAVEVSKSVVRSTKKP